MVRDKPQMMRFVQNYARSPAVNTAHNVRRRTLQLAGIWASSPGASPTQCAGLPSGVVYQCAGVPSGVVYQCAGLPSSVVYQCAGLPVVLLPWNFAVEL